MVKSKVIAISCKLLIICFIIIQNKEANAAVQKMRVATLMGSKFDITVVAENDSMANSYIDTCIKEIARIESVISEWHAGTEVWEVNQNAGLQPIKVSAELFNLTQKALYFSQITNGAFDISIAAMDKIWFFDGTMHTMPSPAQIKQATANVGYQKIVLNEKDTSIFLTQKGMKIGFGSIGKGYAADKGRALLKKLGVKGGIVNASGDLSTWGSQKYQQAWKIGITNPFKTDRFIRTIPIFEKSITTSGSYAKYALIKGKRYAHIINPATGYPSTGLISVTVIGNSAETCNGISTSMMVLGIKKSKQLLKKFPSYKAILITDKGSVIQI